MNKFEIKKRNT